MPSPNNESGYPSEARQSRSPGGMQWPVLGVAAIGAIVAGTFSIPADAASLTNWQFDPAQNRLEITVKDGTTPRYFLMAQPARIVVDLPGTAVGDVDGQKSYAGAIRQIRVSQFQPGLTRIVMEISPDVALAPGQVKLQKVASEGGQADSSRWVVRPLIAGDAAPQAATPTVLATRPTPIAARSTPKTLPAPSVAVPPLPTAAQPAPIAPRANPPANAPALATAPSTPKPSLPTTPAPTAPSPSSPVGTTPAPAATAVGPVDLAPVLPSSPAKTVPTTPVSPTVSTPDADLAVDTQGSVAIAVPKPDAVPPKPTVTVPQVRPAPIQPAGTGPIALASPPRPTVVSPVTVTPSPSRTTAPTVAQPPREAFASSDIPTTLAAASGQTPTVSVPPLPRRSTPVAPPVSATTPPPPTGATVSVPPVPSSGSGDGDVPNTANPMGDAAATPQVAVPPLHPSTVPTFGTQTGRMSPTPMGNAAPTVSVPPIQPSPTSIAAPTVSGYTAETVRQSPIVPTSAPVVEFGQPLPAIAPSATYTPSLAVPNVQALKPPAPDVVLPIGAVLNLRYPGAAPLPLRPSTPQQEVLLLQSDIRDAAGRVIAPEGSTVVGRFETSPSGTRFVTQAISLPGRSLALSAQSDSLGGNRQVSDTALVRNSGIGVLAGGILGAVGGSAGLGVVSGAAAGAATTFLTAPKTATIQPGQVIPVRLTQDLR